jgi:hypothetical protein
VRQASRPFNMRNGGISSVLSIETVIITMGSKGAFMMNHKISANLTVIIEEEK